ncbi:MAG: transposase [Chlamydia sp.]
MAGRGYDSNNLRHMLAEMNIDRMIPGRKNRIEPIEYDRHSYKERNAIKRFFGRLKEYRRIATRYDKTEIMLKARVVLGCIFMWLKV